MDLTTLIGVALGFLSIALGNIIEGGHFSALIQFTAFIIVFGGTLGATIVSNSLEDINRSMELLKLSFKKDDDQKLNKVYQHMVEAAKTVRQKTLIGLEESVNGYANPFMQSVFKFALDGVDAKIVEDVFYGKIDIEEEKQLAGAKVWEDAGGFAPTIGIIGAVLGLIHVMGNLSDTSELGKGIAVAFVATVYGVGSANLLFLPIANKIKSKIKKQKLEKEMIVDGVVSILKGASPHIVSIKMQSYLDH